MNLKYLAFVVVLPLAVSASLVACGDDDDVSCTDECLNEGVSRCNATSIEACQRGAEGCLAWTVTSECADLGQVCRDQAGVVSCEQGCEDACEATTWTQCNGTVIETCGLGANGCLGWVAGTDCADASEICDDSDGSASCVCADTCPAENDARCSGTVIENCSLGADGCLDWVSGTDCAATDEVCDDTSGSASCVCTDLCPAAGDSQCNGTVIETCGQGGEGCLGWIAGVDCAAGGSGDVCDDSGGTASCACTDACPAANDTQCNGAVIETCTVGADGCLDWVAGTDCAATNDVCDDTSGAAVCECTDLCPAASDTQCNGAVIETCTVGADGCLEWVGGTDCGATAEVCDDTGGSAICVCNNDCVTVGETQCNGTVIQTCTQGAGGCLGWVAGTDCAATAEVCNDSGGSAVCQVPPPLTILLMGEDVTDPAPGGWEAYRTALTAAGMTWTEHDLDTTTFPDPATLGQYNTLIWFDENTLSVSDADCQVVADWLVTGGKNLFISSIDHMWDLENGTAGQGENNLYLLLESEYLGDYAGTGIATLDGVAGDPVSADFVAPGGLSLAGTADSNGDYVNASGASLATLSAFYGAGGTGSGHAGLSHYTDPVDGYRTVWLGVNFHNGLTDAAQRNLLMSNIITFFAN